jgi:chromosome partitioning protein
MRVLAVANQKGGVGKSTLTVHLAYAALEAGLRVLLVDMDKQGSLSLTFTAPQDAQPGLMTSKLFDVSLAGGLPQAVTDKLSIIRADGEVLGRLLGVGDGIEKRPAAHLRSFARQFDLCLIDTPGSLGFNPPMTVGALVAADAVVCPFAVGLYEADALKELWGYLKTIKTAAFNPKLRLMGLLPSKVNTKSKEEREALADLRVQLGNVILPLVLAERVAVKQATMKRRPVWKSTRGAGHQKAAVEWREACNYILGNLGDIKK